MYLQFIIPYFKTILLKKTTILQLKQIRYLIQMLLQQ